MRLRAAITGRLDELLAGERDELAGALTAAVRDATDGLKAELRAQVDRAGMGRRLANTWRSDAWPKRGRASLGPAGLVWSNAPDIIGGHDSGGIIRARGGTFLAIPTANVPLARGGGRGARRRMTPVEVEAAFDQDLVVRPAGPRRPGVFVAGVNAVASRNRRGFRKGTARRLASGRNLQFVAMFVLVRQVRLRKVLDVNGASRRWEQRLLRDVAAITGGG